MISDTDKFKWVRKAKPIYETGPRYELFIGSDKYPTARITHESRSRLGISYNIEHSPRGLYMFKHSPFRTVSATKTYIEKMYGLRKSNEITRKKKRPAPFGL